MATTKTTIVGTETTIRKAKITIVKKKTVIEGTKTAIKKAKITIVKKKTVIGGTKTAMAGTKTAMAGTKTAMAGTKTAMAGTKTAMAGTKTVKGGTVKKTKIKIKYGLLEPPLYNIDDNSWLSELETEGFVVIKDIINDEMREDVIETFKQEFKEVAPQFNWNDKTTWVPANCPMVWCKSSVVFNGFGQSKSAWKLRLNKKVQKPFKIVYKTDKIATSFDGFSLFLSKTQKSPKWLHQDQRPGDKRLSIQGAINLFKVGKEDAGFVVVPKSHKTHIPKPSKKDWIMLDSNDPHYKSAFKLIIPKNCIVLWNSKTIHANIGMTKKTKEINRLTSYVSFVPKNRQTEEIVTKREEGYIKGDTTSHWADRHEVKQVPWRIQKRYKERNFHDLKPILKDGKIPTEYKELI